MKSGANLQKRVWITWEQQRRNRTLSRALNAKLFQFDFNYSPIFRYTLALWKTLNVFISERPDIIFVQNPSIVLAFFSVTYGLLVGIPVIVDAHNAGVYPFAGKKMWANKIAEYLFRNASATLVSNEILAGYVRAKGGNAIVVPDPIPEFKAPLQAKLFNGTFNVLFICSWADDEPYVEVMKAAAMLEDNIRIYITGKSKGRERKIGNAIPENVVLTGYLPEEEYEKILLSSDAVIDLTTRSDCLVCGAYESVAAEKPLIVSDSKVLRDYFSKGVLYTDNTSLDLALKINTAILKREQLQREIRELKIEKQKEWANLMSRIENVLSKLI